MWLAAGLWLALALVARAQAAEPPLLQLDGREDSLHLTAWSQLLEDPGAQLDLAQVRAADPARWQAGPPHALNVGYSRSAWWLRWRLRAPARPMHVVLDLGSAAQDLAELHVLRDGAARVQLARTGDRLRFAERQVPTRKSVLAFELGAGEAVELYLRVGTHDGLHDALPVRLFERRAFLAAFELESLLLSLFHGGLLALAAYNLLLFVATRQAAFGLYVVYMLIFLGWSFTFRGYSLQFLWPESPHFNNNILNVLASGIFASVGAFAVSYLDMRRRLPRWMLRLTWALIGLNALVIVPTLAGHYAMGAICG